MKHKILLLALSALVLCSCRGKIDTTTNNLPTDTTNLEMGDSLVMKYVTCSKDVVDTLFATGDSVYAQTDIYTIENLGVENEEINNMFAEIYGDTIPAIVSIYDSYHKITSHNNNEDNNASFVWHEVAKAQLARFLGKDSHKVTDKDINSVFRVANDILEYYSGGSQAEMNASAGRRILLADYSLLDAYKRLMDRFPSAQIKELVHADYRYLLNTCRKFTYDRYEENYYSDLPRELTDMLHSLLLAKAAAVDRLITAKAGEQAVRNNLREHYCFENRKYFRLSYAFLDKYSHNFS